MYSKNIQNLLALMIGKDGTFNIDMNDDILNQTIITQDGQILHQGTQARLNPAPIAAAS
jgi:hypothetical protein